jgi:tryptophan 2,3-dioxygenase
MTAYFDKAMINGYQYRVVEIVPGQGAVAFYYSHSQRDEYMNEVRMAQEHDCLVSYGAIRMHNAR